MVEGRRRRGKGKKREGRGIAERHKVSIGMQIHHSSSAAIVYLFIIIGEHPYDPGKVLPALGFALVAARMEIACHGGHPQSQVPVCVWKRGREYGFINCAVQQPGSCTPADLSLANSWSR